MKIFLISYLQEPQHWKKKKKRYTYKQVKDKVFFFNDKLRICKILENSMEKNLKKIWGPKFGCFFHNLEKNLQLKKVKRYAE